MDDDLVFVDTAEEALLPRGYTLPRKKPKAPRPTVSGVRRKPRQHRRDRAPQRPAPRKRRAQQRPPHHLPPPPARRRFISVSNIIAMLESPSADVARQGMQALLDLTADRSPEARFRVREITKRDMDTLTRLLERYATRRNPAPSISIPSLARQTLTRLRRARHEAGMPVFRHNPAPMQWVFRDGTMLPFPPMPHSKRLQRRER